MNHFEKHLFVGKRGSKLPYRLLRPKNVVRGERYPLVVFLHGAGERGSDNNAQLKWCACDFAKPEVRAKHLCFVVVPQCPKGDKWVETPWDQNRSFPMPTEPSPPMRSLIGLIDRLERELPIDSDRIYLGGLSMGGYGVWDLVARQPKRFAAVFPICGGGDPDLAKSFTHVPFWVFHGEDDEIVPIARSQEMVDALKTAGAMNVQFRNYPGVGHHSWLNAFAEPELFDWLFSQRRS
jgi:predicted peptidase